MAGTIAATRQKETVMAQQTITGACHCGKVRIEADLDLAAGTNRCNCSICSKLRAWTAIVKPQAVRLLAGQSDLSGYQWGAKISTRMFCKHCGVHVFSRGFLQEVGGDFCSVNIAVLDLEPAMLATIPVNYCDGLHNNWTSPPQHTAYL
jgi:hypothetical protein